MDFILLFYSRKNKQIFWENNKAKTFFFPVSYKQAQKIFQTEHSSCPY